MKESITLERLNERIPRETNLGYQEYLATQVGENRLNKYQLLEKEIKELDYYVSRFATEGATLRQINQYKVLMDYVKLLYQKEEFYKCAKVSTVLKLFFDLDLTFFTILPELSLEIEKRGPIHFQTLVNTARRNVKKDPNQRGR